MSQFSITWQRIPNLLSTIRVTDVLDILIVAYLIYKSIMLIRRTNSFHLARGILIILVALGWLSAILQGPLGRSRAWPRPLAHRLDGRGRRHPGSPLSTAGLGVLQQLWNSPLQAQTRPV